jgi:hypothetical protein
LVLFLEADALERAYGPPVVRFGPGHFFQECGHFWSSAFGVPHKVQEALSFLFCVSSLEMPLWASSQPFPAAAEPGSPTLSLAGFAD